MQKPYFIFWHKQKYISTNFKNVCCIFWPGQNILLNVVMQIIINSTKIVCYVSRVTIKPTIWHVRPAKTQISLGICPVWSESSLSAWRNIKSLATHWAGERGGSVVECRTPEREVRGSRPTAAVLCPWARHFTPRKYWLITQEAMAPSRYDWKIVDWDVKPQHNQPTNPLSAQQRLWSDRADAQADSSLRWAHTSHFVGFVMLQLMCQKA